MKQYDEGIIIFQEKVTLSENETSETVANKVHDLEYEYFPKVIEGVLKL